MKKMLLAVVTTASFLGLAACDSATENAKEDQAEVVRENADATADAMENKADTLDAKVDGVDSTAEQALEDKAAVVREQGDAKADAMEDKADATK